MKQLLLVLALLAGGTAQAQIVKERNYPILVTPGKLSTGDVKYAGYYPTGQVRIYNLDHSIYKQVPFTLPSGYTVDGISYLSDKLFNTNSALEFIVNTRSSFATGSIFGTRILDENGTVLLARDTTAYPQIYSTPSGTKMLLSYYDNSTSKVYSLGGTLTALAVAPKATTDAALPYPNPTTAEIKLPYTVAAGQIADLIVRDATGRQVAAYRVDSAFDHLLFPARGLAPGVYFYTVGSSPARRFTVQ